jgi:hypothetical protein
MAALCVVAYAVVINVRAVMSLPSLDFELTGSGAMSLMAWLTPFVLVAVLALTHPTAAAWLLAVATIVLLGVQVVLLPSTDLSWLPATGERAILLADFAIAVLVAILGLQRPGVAGVVLLLLAVAPVPTPGVAAAPDMVALTEALTNGKLPFAVAGLVMLVAAATVRGRQLPQLSQSRRHQQAPLPPEPMRAQLPARFSTHSVAPPGSSRPPRPW